MASNMLGTPLPDRKPHPNSPITPRHQIRDLSKSPRKLNNLKQTELVWWVLLERMQFTFNSLSCSYLLDGNRVSAVLNDRQTSAFTPERNFWFEEFTIDTLERHSNLSLSSQRFSESNSSISSAGLNTKGLNATPAHSSIRSANTDGASVTQSSDSGNDLIC